MFKVGDRLKFKEGNYNSPHSPGITNETITKERNFDINAIYEVEEVHSNMFSNGSIVLLKGCKFNSDRFVLSESRPQPSIPQVGDIFANGNKTEVVRVVSFYMGYDCKIMICLLVLKSYKYSNGYVRSLDLECFDGNFPLFLSHEPTKSQKHKKLKKTTKQSKLPEQHEKDDWYFIGFSFASGFFSKPLNNIVYYRRGNKIKAVYEGLEAVATCNEKETFSGSKGRYIAGSRVMSLWFAKIAEEESKKE